MEFSRYILRVDRMAWAKNRVRKAATISVEVSDCTAIDQTMKFGSILEL
jgi:hypothetical protein